MHPALGWAGGIILAHVLALVYVTYVATSPTAETRRRNLVSHASKDVLGKLTKLGKGPNPKKLKSLRADLTLLRKNIKVGWVTSEEQGAGVRVCAYILGAHTKATALGVWHSIQNSAESANKAAHDALDAIFSPHFVAGDPDRNIRS